MPQQTYNLQQGESQVFVVEIIKDAVGVDLTAGVTNIYAEIYIVGKMETSIKFALSPNSGEKSLTINTTDNFKVDLPMERADTALLDIGALTCSVIVEKSDATLPSGKSHDEFSNIYLGTLSKGNLKDVQLT